MRPSVKSAAFGFTKGLEGYVDDMYTDIRGLVTVGMGNLIDPLPLALALPWLHRADNASASADDIAAEWHTVKNGRIAAFGPRRPLYLSSDGIEALFYGVLAKNEAYLSRRWSSWADWPADAQLGAHSCAWAAGPSWQAPKFDAGAATDTAAGFAICAGPDGDANVLLTCRGEAWLRDGLSENAVAASLNPGLRTRNLRNKILFQNASRVLTLGKDPDVLQWPNVVRLS